MGNFSESLADDREITGEAKQLKQNFPRSDLRLKQSMLMILFILTMAYILKKALKSWKFKNSHIIMQLNRRRPSNVIMAYPEVSFDGLKPSHMLISRSGPRAAMIGAEAAFAA